MKGFTFLSCKEQVSYSASSHSPTVSTACLALDLQFVERVSSHFGLSKAEFLVNISFHLVAALQTQAMTRISLVRLLNFLMSISLVTAEPAGDLRIRVLGSSGLFCCASLWFLLTCALVSAAEKAFLQSLFMPSLAYAAISLADLCGHSFTGCLRNAGPSCHMESSWRSSGAAPLVMSALFRPPGIHHQSSTDVGFWISPTLFAKKV